MEVRGIKPLLTTQITRIGADGTITSTTGFVGTSVWDGRQYVAVFGGWSCTSTVNIPWVNMEYDVSNLSGNNISFRFRQISDSAVQNLMVCRRHRFGS